MSYVALLPLFLLQISPIREGIVLPLVFLLVIGKLTDRRHEKFYRSGKKASGAGDAVTIVIAAILGVNFYSRWISSNGVIAIAGAFGISVQLFVGFAAVLLTCAAACGINWLLYDVVSVLGETYSLDLPVQPDQAGRLSVKLDRSAWLLCAGLALAYVIVFSNTCPFMRRYPTTDSGVYLYIGREMLQGKIPYVDLFDHKGIILYFIQWLGSLLSLPGTYSGVWLIEWASLFVTAIFMYKTVRLLTASKDASYLVLLIILIGTSVCYVRGNLTESYALPWIAMAVYIYLKFFATLRYQPAEVAALGVGCAVVAFLQVNLIGIWIAFTPLVVFFLLKERKFIDIFRCIGCFVGGLAVVCIPLGIYFGLTGSLDSMIKYYIQFNMTYTGADASVINQLEAILMLGEGVLIAEFISAAIVYRYIKFKKVFWINMWGFAVSMYFATISGRVGAAHYGLVLFPLLVVPVWCIIQALIYYAEQKNTSEKNVRMGQMFRNQRRVTIVSACLVVFAVVLLLIAREVIYYVPDPISEYLSEETDKSDDVLIIGNKAGGYLESDRRTDNRFFYQFPPIRISNALYGEFLEELNQKPSDYIIVYSNIIVSLQERLNQWLQEGVYNYEDHGTFAVYRRH